MYNLDEIGKSREYPNGMCLSFKEMYKVEVAGVDKCDTHKQRKSCVHTTKCIHDEKVVPLLLQTLIHVLSVFVIVDIVLSLINCVYTT